MEYCTELNPWINYFGADTRRELRKEFLLPFEQWKDETFLVPYFWGSSYEIATYINRDCLFMVSLYFLSILV